MFHCKPWKHGALYVPLGIAFNCKNELENIRRASLIRWDRWPFKISLIKCPFRRRIHWKYFNLQCTRHQMDGWQRNIFINPDHLRGSTSSMEMCLPFVTSSWKLKMCKCSNQKCARNAFICLHTWFGDLLFDAGILSSETPTLMKLQLTWFIKWNSSQFLQWPLLVATSKHALCNPNSWTLKNDALGNRIYAYLRHGQMKQQKS